MLGYATPNDASDNATFLFDDIQQTKSTVSTGKDQSLPVNTVYAYPNPATNLLTLVSKNTQIKSIALFDMMGNQLHVTYPNSTKASINIADFSSGMYIAKYATDLGTNSIRFVVE